MKILYYNWAPLFDPLKRGGGVRIYQENLIKKAVSEGHRVTYFSAGVRYNLLRPGLRLSRPIHHANSGVREFEILNSPILAPSFHQFGREISVEEEQAYVDFLLRFIEAEGPFDVIHFNNIEGLPVALFNERTRIKAKSVVLSLHNYHVLCQQVNLWHDDKIACYDYQDGKRCTHCVVRPSTLEIKAACTFHDLISATVTEGGPVHISAFRFYHFAKNWAKWLLKIRRWLRDHTRTSTDVDTNLLHEGAKFKLYRKTGVAAINNGIDVSVAVSQRVSDIFQREGVRAEKILTGYIATNFADELDREGARERTARRVSSGGSFTIGYLGYARKDKGFFFLLDALAAVHSEVKKKVKVVIAARGAPIWRHLVEDKLRGFQSWKIIDGYDHAELREILADVDMGIVPVLWEDCLPQVAYEFICNKIPIMVSDMGGAQELVQPQELVFKVSEIADFVLKFSDVVADTSILNKFWDFEASPILNWDSHWQALSAIYESRAGSFGDGGLKLG